MSSLWNHVLSHNRKAEIFLELRVHSTGYSLTGCLGGAGGYIFNFYTFFMPLALPVADKTAWIADFIRQFLDFKGDKGG